MNINPVKPYSLSLSIYQLLMFPNVLFWNLIWLDLSEVEKWNMKLLDNSLYKTKIDYNVVR